MKSLHFLTVLLTSCVSLHAGESALTTTYQPLTGLGTGGIRIVQVTCHDWYSHSGTPTQIPLISAKNVPPTNNPKQATQDLNLASTCGLRFHASEPDSGRELILDATSFPASPQAGTSREEILRASLECLRRCLPENWRRQALTLNTSDEHKEWMAEIVNEFNTHDRTKVFFTSEE